MKISLISFSFNISSLHLTNLLLPHYLFHFPALFKSLLAPFDFIPTHPSFSSRAPPSSTQTSPPSFCLSIMMSALLLLLHFVTTFMSFVLAPLVIIDISFFLSPCIILSSLQLFSWRLQRPASHTHKNSKKGVLAFLTPVSLCCTIYQGIKE